MVVAKVISETKDDEFYAIIESNGTRRFRCTCPHNTFRGVTCKHIRKYKVYLKQKTFGIVIPGVFPNEGTR